MLIEERIKEIQEEVTKLVEEGMRLSELASLGYKDTDATIPDNIVYLDNQREN